MKRILFYVLIGCSAALQAQEVAGEANTRNIKIGEQIQYKITVAAPTNAVVAFPEGQTFAPLEMVKTRPADTLQNGEKRLIVKEYYLTQFDEGKYIIPSQKVRIDQRDYFTDSLQVMVHNVAIDTLKQPLYDIKGIQEISSPAKSYFWLWLIGGIWLSILAITLLYFLVIKKKKLFFLGKAKVLPPFDRAIQDLKDLQNSKYLIQSQHKEYYTRLTDIVKAYLEDEVHILAKESTTDELLEKINTLQSQGKLNLSEETISNLKRVLQNADLVKFAKNKPSDNNAEYDRETIENVVIRTQEAIPTEVVEDVNGVVVALKTTPRKKRSIRYWRYTIGLCSLVLFFIVIGIAMLRFVLFSTYSKYNDMEWVTSDYGYPITELTTPEVLIRKQIVDVTEYKNLINEQYTFYYGSLNSPLYIMTNIITFKNSPSNQAPQSNEQSNEMILEPQKVNEIVLGQLDRAGAKNITTLQEEYTTSSGAKGMKVFGKMTLPDEKGKPFNASYELYSFTENNALQQVLITYIEEASADKIAQRIIHSIAFKTE